MSTKKTMFTIVFKTQSVSKSTDLKTAISYGVTIAVNMRAMTVTLAQVIIEAQAIRYDRRKTKRDEKISQNSCLPIPVRKSLCAR